MTFISNNDSYYMSYLSREELSIIFGKNPIGQNHYFLYLAPSGMFFLNYLS